MRHGKTQLVSSGQHVLSCTHQPVPAEDARRCRGVIGNSLHCALRAYINNSILMPWPKSRWCSSDPRWTDCGPSPLRHDEAPATSCSWCKADSIRMTKSPCER